MKKWIDCLPNEQKVCEGCPIFKALVAVFRYLDEEAEIRIRDELRKMEDPYP